ncbi:MAG: glutaredoxin [Simkaniaceae bacterium]|nr:glutaredoxin [Simkaniaceae bacterium]
MDISHHAEVQQPTLILYHFAECPYCKMVIKVIQQRGIPVELRNIRENAEYRNELVSQGGKGQVPCLFIDGRPLYESKDIITYLQSIR